MTVALLFPGQGSQEVGMGRALAERFPVSDAVFTEADRALPEVAGGLRALCFEGPLEALTLTANTQPALVATSVAALAALRERVPSLTPAFYAGHSLGEYSALVAAGALSLESTLRLVRLRGEAMQAAVPPGEGSMAALMGMEEPSVEALCARVHSELPDRVLSPANYNAPGQIVLAGHTDAVQRACALASEFKGRGVMLKVSAPFHCAMMEPAAARLGLALRELAVGPLAVPVVANVDAAPNSDAQRVKTLLERQVAGAVRWEQCVRAMVDRGVDTFVEVGPGRVLAGLVRRIHKPARMLSVSDPASLEETAAALGA